MLMLHIKPPPPSNFLLLLQFTLRVFHVMFDLRLIYALFKWQRLDICLAINFRWHFAPSSINKIPKKKEKTKKKKNRKCVEKKLKKMKWGNEAKSRRSRWGRQQTHATWSDAHCERSVSLSLSLSLPECVLHSPLLGAQSTLQFCPLSLCFLPCSAKSAHSSLLNIFFFRLHFSWLLVAGQAGRR